MFEDLVWQDDRVTLNGITFLLEGAAPRSGGDEDSLWLYKDRGLLDAYDALFGDYPSLRVRNCFELGIWKGGSVVLWMEALQPEKLVAVDILDRKDRPAFRRYVEERHLERRLKTYWGTDQTNTVRLMEIVRAEFDGPLDLVIDDASHEYEPTTASMQALFPLLREGGLYIVEDWGWHFADEFRADHAASERGLVPLLDDLTGIVIGSPGLIRRLDVRRPFFVIERGPMPEAEAVAAMASAGRQATRTDERDPLALKMRRLKRRVAVSIRGGPDQDPPRLLEMIRRLRP